MTTTLLTEHRHASSVDNDKPMWTLGRLSSKRRLRYFGVLTCVGAAYALTGCHTTEGVGRDVEAAGGAVGDAAADANPDRRTR